MKKRLSEWQFKQRRRRVLDVLDAIAEFIAAVALGGCIGYLLAHVAAYLLGWRLHV